MQRTVSLYLDATYAGTTGFQAQLVDSDGDDVGTPITAGFAEIGGGHFTWTFTVGSGSGEVPETHQGAVKFLLSDDTFLTSLAFNGVPLADSAPSVDAPDDPDLTNAYTMVYDEEGLPSQDPITFALRDPPPVNASFSHSKMTATAGTNGLLQVTLWRSSSYIAKRGSGGPEVPFTTGTAGTYELPPIPTKNVP